MTEHRFVLQPYDGRASRFRCPQCNHRSHTFKRYIDLETGDYLADHVGRCDRADQCGYHCTPRQYFAENAGHAATPKAAARPPAPANRPFHCIDNWLVTDSMAQKACTRNHFMVFLADIFGWETALQTAVKYKIGTSKHWPGATVFWEIDTSGNARTGKVMLFDKDTGKRVKHPYNHIAWVHTLLSPKSKALSTEPLVTKDLRLNAPGFQLRQCFFGEHLLNEYPDALVGIAESEKTAVMASIMMPDLVWLAAGNKYGLTEDKCRALENRSVLLFPDVGAYTYWQERARTLNLKFPAATFAVHDEMERTATDEERAAGADMADRWVKEHQQFNRTA